VALLFQTIKRPHGRQGTVPTRFKLVIAGLTAALILMMAIASASANRL